MILYISNATDYAVFDELFRAGKLSPAHQMQKFNSSIITGLSQHDNVVALSALPYLDVSAPRVDKHVGRIHYIAIKNTRGRFHKPSNLLHLLVEGIRSIRKKRPRYILCDAISVSPCYVSLILSYIFKIPLIGIVTDLPGLLRKEKNVTEGLGRMRRFDGYILLTAEMNPFVNPKKKPYLVMEGLLAPNALEFEESKSVPRIVLYTGALWKHDAGIEYFVEGFLNANIENCELHLYGVGELEEWLKEVGHRHPTVKYMGCVTNEEVVREQQRATLLVNPRPSTEEFCKYSFPSKTMEYMASGTPILMTRLPGVPEEYFNYLYTINKETSEGVLESLKSIFQQNQRELTRFGMNARNFVMENKGCRTQCKKINEFCMTIKKMARME